MGERMKVLVTGGAGYIGSHTVVELVAAGFDVHLTKPVDLNAVEQLLARLGDDPLRTDAPSPSLPLAA